MHRIGLYNNQAEWYNFPVEKVYRFYKRFIRPFIMPISTVILTACAGSVNPNTSSVPATPTIPPHAYVVVQLACEYREGNGNLFWVPISSIGEYTEILNTLNANCATSIDVPDTGPRAMVSPLRYYEGSFTKRSCILTVNLESDSTNLQLGPSYDEGKPQPGSAPCPR